MYSSKIVKYVSTKFVEKSEKRNLIALEEVKVFSPDIGAVCTRIAHIFYNIT